MRELILKPSILSFESCKEFAEECKIGPDDLVLTNQYIYDPLFGGLKLGAQVIYQENYGGGEPSDVMVEAILKEAGATPTKRIIAIGGGTIIDIAKIMAVAEGVNVDVLYDNAANLKKRVELLIVPTTCGTGSEVSNLSILNRTRLGTKMGLASDAMFPDSAVLIPELLNGLPFGVFATSSIDALIHAVEAGLSPKATQYTKLFSDKALEMIVLGYQKIAKDGPEARMPLLKDFLIASNYAGVAFSTAGVGAVHALSYPLGGKYHVPHGESNYAVFTGVMKNYAEIRMDGALADTYGLLGRLLGCSIGSVNAELEKLLGHILPKKALSAYGVTREDLPEFAESVMQKQGRLMANNFVELDAARVLKIYTELF